MAVTLTVEDGPEPPRIALSTGSIDHDMVEGEADPQTWTVDVTNEGEEPLEGLAVEVGYGASSSEGWLTATLDGSAAPTALRLEAAVAELPHGRHLGRVEVTSPVAANAMVPLNVVVEVKAAEPILELQPLGRFTATTGTDDPDPQYLSIRNGGTGELHGITYEVAYGAGEPAGWLETALDTTRVNLASILLSPRTGSLPAGLYTATVTVDSPDATNGPQSIDVLFEVRPPGPVIDLDQPYVYFNTVVDGPTPAPRTV